jgi:glycerol-3-phosphate O-acyltransferase
VNKKKKTYYWHSSVNYKNRYTNECLATNRRSESEMHKIHELQMILCQRGQKDYLTVSLMEYLVFERGSNPVDVLGRIDLSMVNLGQFRRSDRIEHIRIGRKINGYYKRMLNFKISD